MSKETTIVQLPIVQQSSGTTPAPIVPAQPSLSPQEIERICRCFIRLISAKETTHEEFPTSTKPYTN